VTYVKLSDATGDGSYAERALNVALDMQKGGALAPRDAWMVDDLRRRSGQ